MAWAPRFSEQLSFGDEHKAAPPDAVKGGTPASGAAGAGPLKATRVDRSELESLQPLPVKDFSTLNGPRAYVRQDHSLPMVTIGFLFQGGRIVEDDSNSGITEFMLRSLLYGTERRTADQIGADLDQLGAQVEPVAQPDFFGITLSVSSSNAGPAIRLARD